ATTPAAGAPNRARRRPHEGRPAGCTVAVPAEAAAVCAAAACAPAGLRGVGRRAPAATAASAPAAGSGAAAEPTWEGDRCSSALEEEAGPEERSFRGRLELLYSDARLIDTAR